MKIPVTEPTRPRAARGCPSNTTQIFIGLLLGILIGYLLPSSDANGVHTPGFGEQIKPLADTFLRMIKMIIAPLLFATLVVGIAGTGDLKSMGRIGLKAIIYFEVATTIALFLGLFIVNFFQPGVGVQAPAMSIDSLKGVQSIQAHTGWDMLVSLFPTSVIDAMARGDILQLVVFSIFFGVGLAAVGERGQARARRAREHRAGDVQVHRLRDDVRADRRHGGDLGHGRQDGPRHPVHARQARGAHVRRPHRLRHHRHRRRVGT